MACYSFLADCLIVFRTLPLSYGYVENNPGPGSKVMLGATFARDISKIKTGMKVFDDPFLRRSKPISAVE